MLLRCLKPQWPRVLLTSFLLFIAIALQLASPQIIRYFLDTAQVGAYDSRALLGAALIFIGFALLQQGMTLAANYTGQRVSWTATNRLRTDLTLHCMRLDMSFHKQHTPGELIERIDGDVTRLSNFFSQFAVRMATNGLLLVGILVLLFGENSLVGVGMLIYTALTLVVLGWIQKLAAPRWIAARQVSAEQYGYIEERITGVEDIRAIGAEPYVMSGLYRLMRAYLEKHRVAWVINSLAYNLTNLVYVIGYAAGLALGVYLYSQHQATLGTAYLIVYYVGMLATPLQGIREQAQDLQQATASIRRIEELFRLQPQVTDPAHDLSLLPAGPLAVSFEGVSFRYEDNENVLNEVSFGLAPGKVLGIVGRTGSGKSTLSRLLFRLYDPAQGVIRLGNVDIRKVALADLRQRVGMVTQDVQLFQATLRDNLTFFNRQIRDKKLVHVLQEVGLWDWVQSLPDGLNTPLLAGGTGLSAGEAQMLAFGRVFLKDPGLVILDEASSRLDPATEARLERAIDSLFSGRTGVIIAHRLKTLDRVDEILILDQAGRISEYGPRQKLAGDPHSHFYRDRKSVV